MKIDLIKLSHTNLATLDTIIQDQTMHLIFFTLRISNDPAIRYTTQKKHGSITPPSVVAV